jgi:hypothetical protein
VGSIGQIVEGEAVLTVGRPSLLFLEAGPAGARHVAARAQGQFPVVLGADKSARLMRSHAVGVVLPPLDRATPATGTVQPQGKQSPTTADDSDLAARTLSGLTIDDAARLIQSAWSRSHAK